MTEWIEVLVRAAAQMLQSNMDVALCAAGVIYAMFTAAMLYGRRMSQWLGLAIGLVGAIMTFTLAVLVIASVSQTHDVASHKRFARATVYSFAFAVVLMVAFVTSCVRWWDRSMQRAAVKRRSS